MAADWYGRCHYGFSRLAGAGLAGVKLNQVTECADAERRVYLKRRRWYTAFLIPGAQALLRPKFLLLSQQEWLQWEPLIYRLAYDWPVEVGHVGELRLPALAGLVLTDLLQSRRHDIEPKLSAVLAALKALKLLHQLWLKFPHGGEGYFSHADATVQNVTFDPATGQAYWFDFETVHQVGLSRVCRQADDLRAFSYSVAALWPEDRLDRLADLVVDTYADLSVLGAFQEIVRQQQRPSAYDLAQTRATYKIHALWSRVLTEKLAVCKGQP